MRLDAWHRQPLCEPARAFREHELRCPGQPVRFGLKLPLRSIDPDSLQPCFVEKRLHRLRASQVRDQDVSRGAVTFHHRAADQVPNTGFKGAPFGDDIGDGLDVDAQIVTPNSKAVSQEERPTGSEAVRIRALLSRPIPPCTFRTATLRAKARARSQSTP